MLPFFFFHLSSIKSAPPLSLSLSSFLCISLTSLIIIPLSSFSMSSISTLSSSSLSSSQSKINLFFSAFPNQYKGKVFKAKEISNERCHGGKIMRVLASIDLFIFLFIYFLIYCSLCEGIFCFTHKCLLHILIFFLSFFSPPPLPCTSLRPLSFLPPFMEWFSVVPISNFSFNI